MAELCCEDSVQHTKHGVRLLERIGAGGFGSVYKGVFDGEIVAVKLVAGASERDEDEGYAASAGLRMFFQEAQVLRRCRHRSIIRFKALVRLPHNSGGVSGKSWALVMEYAKHGNLAQRVLAQMTAPGRRAYSTAQALGWALDLASALEYLHLRSPAILHRDVKSSNVMLAKSEGGRIEAKLSDFGLHVAADDTKRRLLRRSFVSLSGCPPPASTSCYLDFATAAADAAAPTGHSSANTVPASAATVGRIAAGDVQQPESAAVAKQGAAWMGGPAARGTSKAADGAVRQPEDPDCYSEVHDGAGGRTVYVHTSSMGMGMGSSTGSSSGSGGSAVVDDATAASGDVGQAGPRRQWGRSHDAVAAIHAARSGPKSTTSSFRRAAHHPTGEALPRVPPGCDQPPDADANAALFAQWAACSGSSTCSLPDSLVTDGTWVSGGTGGSWCDGSSLDGSMADELETVFHFTGCTGSVLYMAPEVYLHQAYNEKGDVFSFGVVLYELLARTLIMFSELPTGSSDPRNADRYADKVAGGYRPSQPKSVPDDLWRLISACWHQDPLMRPHMSEVVAVLSEAHSKELIQQQCRPVGLKAHLRSRLSVGRAAVPVASRPGPTAAVGVGRQLREEDGDQQEHQLSEGRCSAPSRCAAAPAASSQEPVGAPKGCGCVIC